ncbi:MAG: HEAT repeat domain-containing protein, partial [Gemmatimonadetes bacterium]|nr:HEAT repeat domain-containing protein [Gemmatimonadota bacterium]
MISRTRLSLGLLFACAACAAPDPVATSAGEGRSPRADDGLLDTPELQQVVDVAMRRDGGALRAFLSDPDPRVRARASLAFATVRDRTALVDIRALLQDADPRVRADAAFALAHYPGAGEAGDQMLDRLEVETDRDVRAALIDALGKAGLSRSLGALLDLDGPDRANATLALSRALTRGAAPGGAVDSLVARMRDPDPVVRRNAAYFMERVDDVLVWIDHRRSIRGALDNMAVDDPAAMSIVDGLARRFDVFSLPRIVYRAHNATDWRVRANAMAALRDMGLGASRLGA